MRSSKKNLAVVAALLAAMVCFSLSACRPATSSAGKTHVVHIRGMLFSPAKLAVAAGDAVTWVNEDVFLHAVKSNDAARPWQSPDLPPQASWSRKFSDADQFPYLCPYHPTMAGEIVVSDPSATSR